MPPFDLNESLRTGALRLPAVRTGVARKQRSDLGQSRLPEELIVELTGILHVQERPPMRQVQRDLAEHCRRLNLRMPARATLYHFMANCPPHQYRVAELPEAVRRCLYNLDPGGSVPGHQLAFYAFTYGDTTAMSFAAGLPWLDLYQADRMRGWRPRSHGVLRAVLHRRGI